jgi:hypothetical protein
MKKVLFLSALFSFFFIIASAHAAEVTDILLDQEGSFLMILNKMDSGVAVEKIRVRVWEPEDKGFQDSEDIFPTFTNPWKVSFLVPKRLFGTNRFNILTILKNGDAKLVVYLTPGFGSPAISKSPRGKP